MLSKKVFRIKLSDCIYHVDDCGRGEQKTKRSESLEERMLYHEHRHQSFAKFTSSLNTFSLVQISVESKVKEN